MNATEFQHKLVIQAQQDFNAAQIGFIEEISSAINAKHKHAIAPNAVSLEGIADKQVGTQVNHELKARAFALQLDLNILASERKLSDFKLVAMDMDSTLITIECIDEIADMQGLKPQVAEITEAAMRGEIEFQESLILRVALLKGLDASALQRVYDQRLQLSLGAEKMLQGVRDAGLKTLLVSGGFTFFTNHLKSRLKLDTTHANTLEIIDDKLTGRITGTIVDAQEKQATVERVCQAMGITAQQAIVMGDGANDLKMMSIAGLSLAFRAKPVVRTQANVAFNFVGLDGLLNLF